MSYSMSNGVYVPDQNIRYTLGRGVPKEVSGALNPIYDQFHKSRVVCRTRELEDIARMLDGGAGAINDEFFPAPDGYDPSDWNELRSRLMVLVNLIKASVRKVRSRVYGGYQHRVIVRNPYSKDIERFISGWYPADMRDWFTNRVAFSNSACVIHGKHVKGRKQLRRWLPDPVYTYLSPDPDDSRKYLAIAEFSGDGKRMHFVSKTAEGVIYPGSDPVVVKSAEDIPPGRSYILITDMGFLPAVVAHAEGRRNRRDAYSAPAFRDAIQFTRRATDALFNGSLLQKVQTKGLLAISGSVEEQTMDFSEMMRQGIVYMDGDGKINWVTPSTNIHDTIELMDKIIEVYSVVHAIPLDDLNPTSSKGTSAEEATRRAEPHVSLTREYAEVAALDEEELLLAATGVLKWMDGDVVDLEELRDQVESEISLQPPLKPLTSQEAAQVSQMGGDMGTLLPEDQARVWNPDATPKKLSKVVANMQEAAIIKTQKIKREGAIKKEAADAA